MYMILCIYLNISQKILHNMHEYVWHLNNALAKKMIKYMLLLFTLAASLWANDLICLPQGTFIQKAFDTEPV